MSVKLTNAQESFILRRKLLKPYKQSVVNWRPKVGLGQILLSVILEIIHCQKWLLKCFDVVLVLLNEKLVCGGLWVYSYRQGDRSSEFSVHEIDVDTNGCLDDFLSLAQNWELAWNTWSFRFILHHSTSQENLTDTYIGYKSLFLKNYLIC